MLTMLHYSRILEYFGQCSTSDNSEKNDVFLQQKLVNPEKRFVALCDINPNTGGVCTCCSVTLSLLSPYYP